MNGHIHKYLPSPKVQSWRQKLHILATPTFGESFSTKDLQSNVAIYDQLLKFCATLRRVNISKINYFININYILHGPQKNSLIVCICSILAPALGECRHKSKLSASFLQQDFTFLIIYRCIFTYWKCLKVQNGSWRISKISRKSSQLLLEYFGWLWKVNQLQNNHSLVLRYQKAS